MLTSPMTAPLTLRIRATALLLVLGSGAAQLDGAATTGSDQPALPSTSLSGAQQALHALNRLAYGPRPGEVRAVAESGVAEWITRQLEPDGIGDPDLGKHLAGLESLNLSPGELLEAYPTRRMRARQLRDRGLSEEEIRDELKAGMRNGARRIAGELVTARLLRAVHSERQLQEVMVDFWANHFNVFAGKEPTPHYLVAYERDALRPHALGRFEWLLVATAKSPAMLHYLDNWRSVDPARARGRNRGLNENYARELLELHTLGVDGGYTERDVREVARCFTGWTIEIPRPGRLRFDEEGRPLLPDTTGRFIFRPRLHDDGAKTVLGHRIPAGGGINDGLRVLAILSAHPATARHVSRKLAVRFVSDTPPETLVQAMSETYRSTGGDIREVLRTLFFSPEFWGAQAYRAKVKTPFELVASAIRGTGASVSPSPVLLRQLRALGEIPYGYVPPTGYPDVSSHWLSPGALLDRMNFGIALASNRLRGVRVPQANSRDPEGAVRRWVDSLFAGEIGEATRRAVFPPDPEPETPQTLARRWERSRRALGLLLGSPEFQRQ